MMNMLHKALSPIRVRLSNIVNRAVLSMVKDVGSMQLLQVQIFADEVAEGVEHPQEYGISSNCPVEGAGVVVLCPAGSRDQIMALLVSNPRVRIKDLAVGESALYNGVTGDNIICKADATIEATTDKFICTGDLEDHTETLDDVRQRLAALIDHYNAHLHPVAGAVPAAPPVPPTTSALTPSFVG